MALLDLEQIKTLIPHRYPFLLIDRVEEIKVDEHAIATKAVSYNEWFFQGHFPDKPVMPGVLIIEALAQTAAVFAQKTMMDLEPEKQKGRIVYFASIDEAKFRRVVHPGDILTLKVFKLKRRGSYWKVRGEAWVGDELADEAIFTAMVAE